MSTVYALGSALALRGKLGSQETVIQLLLNQNKGR